MSRAGPHLSIPVHDVLYRYTSNSAVTRYRRVGWRQSVLTTAVGVLQEFAVIDECTYVGGMVIDRGRTKYTEKKGAAVSFCLPETVAQLGGRGREGGNGAAALGSRVKGAAK